MFSLKKRPGKAKAPEKDPKGFVVVKIGMWIGLGVMMFTPFVIIHIAVSVRQAINWLQDRWDQRRKVAEQD